MCKFRKDGQWLFSAGQSLGGGTVSYQAEDMALGLLRRRENMNPTLMSSALASNDEQEDNE